MVIIIGNQKGGAGKSTLTLLLANFLSQVKKWTVTVIDMDYQQSISQKYEKAKILENREPYEVVAAGLEHFPAMMEDIKERPADIVLIDLPGKLDDDGLIQVFKSADLVICPFSYDEFSFESTVFFSLVLRKINGDVPIIYVPNRIKANVKYEIQADIHQQLSNFGNVSPPIPDRIDCQRVSTFQTPLSLYPVIIPVFEQIYSAHIKQNYE
jgi:chromosome partitioning protein